MARKYRALRVPITILQQKVYSTARRLPPLPATVVVEEKRPTSAIVLTPISAGPETPSKYSAFAGQLYLRRFFFAFEENNPTKLACRGCNRIATCLIERSNHVERCYPAVSRTLANLLENKKCVICARPIDTHDCSIKYNGIAVCSPECLHLWDGMIPDTFASLHRERAVTVEREKGIFHRRSGI